MPSNAERHRGALGTVWIVCPSPVPALGLHEFLKAEARVHIGHDSPKDEAPSSIIFCPEGNEDEEVAPGVERLRGAFPQAPVLVFGSRLDRRVVESALRSGASGYLHAEMRPEQIVLAVSVARRGEVVVPEGVLGGLVGEEAPREVRRPSPLSPRQREILGLVAEGLTDAEIADRLYLPEGTVKEHLRHAYKALKVKNRTEAARLWSDLAEES